MLCVWRNTSVVMSCVLSKNTPVAMSYGTSREVDIQLAF